MFDWCACILPIDVKKVSIVKGICNGLGKEAENIFQAAGQNKKRLHEFSTLKKKKSNFSKYVV